jgi:hypothetical protein
MASELHWTRVVKVTLIVLLTLIVAFIVIVAILALATSTTHHSGIH